MMKHACVCALLMPASCSSGEAQNKTGLPTGNIKTESQDVVPHLIVSRTIKHDRKGNIWFAAFDGIFRYDGKSFTSITSKVSSARLFSIAGQHKTLFEDSIFGRSIHEKKTKKN